MHDHLRLILFAHPRSGSSSLYQILQSHPQLRMLEEPFNEGFTRWHPQAKNYEEVVSVSLFDQLQLAASLMVWSIGFYFSHPVLIAISIVPSAIRVAQMLNRRYLTFPALEAIAGLSRVVLVFAIIAVGADISSEALFSGQAFAVLGYNVFTFAAAHWGKIIVQGILFGLLFGLLNLLIRRAVTRLVSTGYVQRRLGESGDTSAVRDALLFLIKNALVIPISLAYMLGVLRVI